MIASRGTSTLCKLEPPADLWSFATSVRCRTDCLLELEHASSPISGRCFKLRYVVSRSERCGFVLPIRCVALTPKSLPASFCFYTPHASMHFANSRLQIWRTAPQSWLPYLTRAMRSKIVAWVQNSRLDTYTSAQTTNAVLHSAAI